MTDSNMRWGSHRNVWKEPPTGSTNSFWGSCMILVGVNVQYSHNVIH